MKTMNLTVLLLLASLPCTNGRVTAADPFWVFTRAYGCDAADLASFINTNMPWLIAHQMWQLSGSLPAHPNFAGSSTMELHVQHDWPSAASWVSAVFGRASRVKLLLEGNRIVARFQTLDWQVKLQHACVLQKRKSLLPKRSLPPDQRRAGVLNPNGETERGLKQEPVGTEANSHFRRMRRSGNKHTTSNESELRCD